MASAAPVMNGPVMNEVKSRRQIVVVGIGVDGMAGLAAASRRELQMSTVVYGSPRQLALLDDTVTADRRVWPSPMLPAVERLLDDSPSGGDSTTGDVHVVASGDPMLHGVGGTLIRVHGVERVRVLPHISSVTLACARMGWSVQDTEVISLVTAPVHTAVRAGGRAVVLSRDASTPAQLAAVLTETGRGASEFTVLELLGGSAERTRTRTAAEWASAPPAVDGLNVVAIRYQSGDTHGPLPPDLAFSHDGQITKHTVRAVTFAALAPRPGELLWDIGSGSGSIAVQWCIGASGCRAVAFESNPERRVRIATNARRFGADIEVRGRAPEAFDGAESPAAIFIGGGVTQPGLVEACLERLPSGGRLVANAVTAESEAALVVWHSRLGGELFRFQHYRGEPLGGFTGWRPAMPITQWVVEVS